jgi:hypothetical protein
LKRGQRPSTSRPVKGSKGFVVRYMWYDDSNYKCSDCGPYADALKEGIVTFREGRIKDAATDEPLETNFD